MSLPAADAAPLRRGFRVEPATMTWMVAEAAVAITAGLLAASIATVGFCLGSVIELLSATIVIWHAPVCSLARLSAVPGNVNECRPVS